MSKTTRTDLICPECGNVFPIMRKSGKQRPLFHRKKLYCYVCKKVTNHIEAKDLDALLGYLSFKEEKNFNEEEKKIYQLIKRKGDRNDN